MLSATGESEAWYFTTTTGSPPEVVQPIADVTAAEDDPDTVIGLGAVFDDPDLPSGDHLTYAATVTMPTGSRTSGYEPPIRRACTPKTRSA